MSGWLNKAAAARTPMYGKGIVGLWKQAWCEIPEVMGSGIYGVMGLCGMLYFGCYHYYKYEVYNHRYKTVMTIYRPEDERIGRVRRFEDSPEATRTPAALKHLYS